MIGTLPTDSVMQYQQLGGNWNCESIDAIDAIDAD